MGYNTKPYDMDAEYSKKPMSELVKIRDQFQKGIDEFEQRTASSCIKSVPLFYNEHLQYVKMKIAERIGK